MSDLVKSLIILDNKIELEYKYKRAFVDTLNGNETFSQFEKLFTEFCNKNLKEFDYSILKNLFKIDVYSQIDKDYTASGITVITEFSDFYPLEYKELPDRPICLYAKGNLSLLSKKDKFSIVGSRKTLPSMLKIAEDYSSKLSSSGVVIVTGVAGGGDLSAIKGAIKSKNLICILAGGFDYINKEYTLSFIEKVSKTCLLLSEYPPFVQAKRYFYPFRNRLIAGLSKGTLIISGSYKSGVKYTANYALDYGKDVFCFPYALGVSSGEICNQIIKDGGYLVTDIEDITQALGFSIKNDFKVSLSETEKVVLSAIKNGCVTVDLIIENTNLKIYEVMPALTSLEIKNLVTNNGALGYSAIL